MSAELVFGDAVGMAVWVLENDEELKERFPDLVVSSGRQGSSSGQNWIAVYRMGGVDRDRVIDMPRLDVHCYGADRTTSHDMAQWALLALRRSRGQLGFGLRVNDIRVDQGISDMPDELTGKDRHFFSVTMFAHAHPEAPALPPLD